MQILNKIQRYATIAGVFFQATSKLLMYQLQRGD